MPMGIKPTDRNRPIEHLAPALINGFQAEILISKYFTDEGPLTVPFQTALLRNPAYLEVCLILQFRHAAGIPARAGLIATLRRTVIKRLVRPLLIVSALKLLERSFLRAARGFRRLRSSLLQR